MKKPEEVVDAFTKRFPDWNDDSGVLSIDAIEKFMRPFYPISFEVQHEIDRLLGEIGLEITAMRLDCWWEANFAVSGSGPQHTFIVHSLLVDQCPCVLSHLPKAIEHAMGTVDPRLIKLRDAWEQYGQDEDTFRALLKHA